MTVFLARQARLECPAAPAPGLRAYQYGTLYHVGGAGFIWSSAIPAGSGNARTLGFGYGGIRPQHYNNRAYGLPLRCPARGGGGSRDLRSQLFNWPTGCERLAEFA